MHKLRNLGSEKTMPKLHLLCSSTPLSNTGHETSGLRPEPDCGVVNNQCLPFFLDASRKTKQIQQIVLDHLQLPVIFLSHLHVLRHLIPTVCLESRYRYLQTDKLRHREVNEPAQTCKARSTRVKFTLKGSGPRLSALQCNLSVFAVETVLLRKIVLPGPFHKAFPVVFATGLLD